ncbi:MAG TPA: helix-turn-helix domain-containing protein [Streptosporangiaceae bacterium]|nr:helix-turn-helix domain-containing protein [Streptosporangiaceae bacterium]
MSSTRARILDAALELTEEHGEPPTMSALARAVGISRQALYLHFPDRAQLLLALVAHLDEREQLQAGIDAVRQALDAAGSIRAFARMQAWHNPKIAALARALDGCRHADPAASAAWRDRTGNRMRGAVSIIERLRAEGRLEPTWTTTEAAALLWELTSFHVWDDLVNDAQIAPDRYVEIITTAALGTLGTPMKVVPGST